MSNRSPIKVSKKDPRTGLLLKLADDELVMGHRLSEWTGWVPYLEADLAFSSIAQDELGHARALYGLAVTIGAADDEDALALGRAPSDYEHAAICQQTNGDFATSLARQWCYDHADAIRLTALRKGEWSELNELLAVVELEENFHRAHADAWFKRLVGGPVAARHKFADALSAHLALMNTFFDPFENEDLLLEEGVLTVPSKDLREQFQDFVNEALEGAGLDLRYSSEDPELVPTASGSVEMRDHSEPPTENSDTAGDFEILWDEMTALYRQEAEARW